MSEELVLENLPTGKPHISFSEIREWKECSYRHKLKFVDKIDLGKPGPFMDFGTAVHAACEHFLRTRVMDDSIATKMIEEIWEKNKELEGFEPKGLPKFLQEARDILTDVPAFMDETFPGWTYIDAEHQLYEQIEGRPHAFKGFIDGVIGCLDKKGKSTVWLLDWKTTSWGWQMQKKTDEMVKAQLVLYKNYWSRKTSTDPKNVKCGFVLLKRTAKSSLHCELIDVSAGDPITERSLKVVNNMVASVKRGTAIKNRYSCTYCDYRDTEHCTLANKKSKTHV